MSMRGFMSDGGAGATTNTDTVILTFPTNAQTGDYAVVMGSNNINLSTATVAGWTPLRGPDAINGQVSYLWGKTLTDGDIADAAVAVVWSVANGRPLAIGGVYSAVTGYDVGAWFAQFAASTIVAPTITTTRAQDDVISIAIAKTSGVGAASTWPVGWTEHQDFATAYAAGINFSGSLGTLNVRGPAGSFGGETVTFGTPAAGSAAYTFGLFQAPPGATVTPIPAGASGAGRVPVVTATTFATIIGVAATATSLARVPIPSGSDLRVFPLPATASALGKAPAVPTAGVVIVPAPDGADASALSPGIAALTQIVSGGGPTLSNAVSVIPVITASSVLTLGTHATAAGTARPPAVLAFGANASLNPTAATASALAVAPLGGGSNNVDVLAATASADCGLVAVYGDAAPVFVNAVAATATAAGVVAVFSYVPILRDLSIYVGIPTGNQFKVGEPVL